MNDECSESLGLKDQGDGHSLRRMLMDMYYIRDHESTPDEFKQIYSRLIIAFEQLLDKESQ